MWFLLINKITRQANVSCCFFLLRLVTYGILIVPVLISLKEKGSKLTSAKFDHNTFKE